MKLDTIRIQNLRSCKDVTVPLNSYTCLVGPNGAGKSTVLCALNIFFRDLHNAGTDVTRLVEEDFHKRDTSEPITITLTFSDLSAEAQDDFAAYYRDGKLIITAEAVFDPATGNAEVKQYGERMVMAEFAKFFEMENTGAKVADLKTEYARLREQITDLPDVKTKDPIVQALRDYEEAHPDRCSPHRSGDQFYGFSKGSNRLDRYVQWVYVPAVKDAATEQVEGRNTALGRLLARTVDAKARFDDDVEQIRQAAQTQYEQLLERNQDVLEGLSASLQERLTSWAHPEATIRLEWFQDPGRAVSIQPPSAQIVAGEDSFEGELRRLGHGLQRSYLLTLLQELATTDDAAAPRLLLGCEEPELYQHPPQARHLFQVFQQLSAQNTQVIVSTHSPLFVSGEMFEDVQLIRKDPQSKQSLIASTTFDEIANAIASATGESVVKPEGMKAKLQQALQANLNEMFFSQRLILVEGLEDVAHITAHLHLSDQWDEFRRLGCQLVAAGGKDRIIQPLAIANQLGIRTLVVFDSDGHKYRLTAGDQPDEHITSTRPAHLRDNTAILKLSGIATPDSFPEASLFADRVVMWHSEIGDVVAEDIGDEWQEYRAQADRDLGQPGRLHKNGMHIALALENAWNAGKRSTHLEQLCERILNAGEPTPARMAAAANAPTIQAPRQEPPRTLWTN